MSKNLVQQLQDALQLEEQKRERAEERLADMQATYGQSLETLNRVVERLAPLVPPVGFAAVERATPGWKAQRIADLKDSMAAAWVAFDRPPAAFPKEDIPNWWVAGLEATELTQRSPFVSRQERKVYRGVSDMEREHRRRLGAERRAEKAERELGVVRRHLEIETALADAERGRRQRAERELEIRSEWARRETRDRKLAEIAFRRAKEVIETSDDVIGRQGQKIQELESVVEECKILHGDPDAAPNPLESVFFKGKTASCWYYDCERLMKEKRELENEVRSLRLNPKRLYCGMTARQWAADFDKAKEELKNTQSRIDGLKVLDVDQMARIDSLEKGVALWRDRFSDADQQVRAMQERRDMYREQVQEHERRMEIQAQRVRSLEADKETLTADVKRVRIRLSRMDQVVKEVEQLQVPGVPGGIASWDNAARAMKKQIIDLMLVPPELMG